MRRLRALTISLSVVTASAWLGCKGQSPAPTPGAAPSASASAVAPAAAVAPCPDGMVALPASKFLRGSEHRPDGSTLDERPAREIEVQAFCLDKTEVTAGAYTKCVDEGACTKARETDKPYVWDEQFNGAKKERATHPANGISFVQAQAYCKHVKKRLPTEIEWEYAARGQKGRTHPWGEDAPSAKLLNACDTSCRAEGKKHKLSWIALFEESDGFAYTAPVGSFPAGATPEGIVDLQGNVAEWTEGSPCAYDKPDCGAKGAVLRGGAWLDQFKGEFRNSRRYWSRSGDAYASSGFRCAR